MNIQKDPKNIEFLDINQTMNGLLSKVAEAIDAPPEQMKKAFIDIRNLLSSLKLADKTQQYVLTEETKAKVEKALSSVELPTDKSLKSIGVDMSIPEQTFKLDESEVPDTEEDGKEKFNQIINANIDTTIKAINEVVETEDISGKEEAEISNSVVEASKLLNGILLTLLARSLKNVRDFQFPGSKDEKENKIIGLNVADRVKSIQTVFQPEDQVTKDASLVTLTSTDSNKSIQEVESYLPKESEKTPYGVGEFPETNVKILGGDLSISLGPDKPPVNDDVAEDSYSRVKDVDEIPTKEAEEVPEYEEPKQEKTLASSDLPDGNLPTGNIDLTLLDPTTEEKTSKDVTEAISVDGKTRWIKVENPETGEFTIEPKPDDFTIPGISGEKPNTPVQWYTNWSIGNENIGASMNVGEALTFFEITSADVGLFFNNQLRSANTTINSFELTRSIQSLTKGYKDPFGPSYLTGKMIEAIKNKENRESGYIKEETVLDSESNIFKESVANRGKLYAAADISLIKAMGKVEANKEKIMATFKSRTFNILNNNVTGFLKVYTKRGPDFRHSNTETEVIPFQFEPKISGDSKNADYGTVATLGRSQSAQVYRRSSERNITLELDYVVANPSSEDEFEYIKSNSLKDMNNWTEDYIYTYIIRNLRNLTLPNISGPRYRLSPPIVQVWYGGINTNSASSTGIEDDPTNTGLSGAYPTFRTNWYTSRYSGDNLVGEQRSYRSLWVCKSVGFEYKGGKVNRDTRNNVWVTAILSLTEIAPSVTDNEVMVWAKLNQTPIAAASPAAVSSTESPYEE